MECTHARALVRNGVAAVTLKLERGSERVLRQLALTSKRCIEHRLVGVLMRLASLIDDSAMPENAGVEVRCMSALGTAPERTAR